MQIIKKIIKDLTPPILLRIFRNKKIKYLFKNKFGSIEDMKNFNKKTSDYLNDDLEDEKTEKFLHPKDIEFNRKYEILPIIAASLINNTIYILEWGGGSNPAYSYIKKSTSKNV